MFDSFSKRYFFFECHLSEGRGAVRNAKKASGRRSIDGVLIALFCAFFIVLVVLLLLLASSFDTFSGDLSFLASGESAAKLYKVVESRMVHKFEIDSRQIYRFYRIYRLSSCCNVRDCCFFCGV